MRNEQVLTRLTTAEKARVEELQRRLQAERPGMNITLSDVMRYAVHVASTTAAYPARVEPPAPKTAARKRKAKADAAA